MPSDTRTSNTATREARTGSHPGATGSGTHARTLAGIQAAIHAAPARGLTVDFNLGSSLDMCTNNGGDVLTLAGALTAPAVTSIDWQKQSAWLAAGASIADVSRELLVQGWALATLGGAASSTVAGALALDARGPHNSDDSETSGLPRMIEFVDGVGNTRQFVGGAANSPAITAIVAGLGLTGVCTEIELPLRPVSTGWMLVDSRRCETSDEVFAQLSGGPTGVYTMARIDPTGRGTGLGRGIAVSGRFAKVAELPEIRQPNALEYVDCAAGRNASRVPLRVGNAATRRALKGITHRTAAAQRRAELIPMASFFHADCELRAAGRELANTITYEFVVPVDQSEMIPRFLDRIGHLKVVGQAATLTRHAPRATGPLGITTDGWKLTIDLDTDVPGLGRVLDDWDEKVAAAGGQVSLATDSRMRIDMIAAMYPDLAKWQELRRYIDPQGHFSSNLARRLSL